MADIPLPSALLVATDFAPCARRALDTALSWSAPTAEITLLHVIDTDLAQRIEQAGLGTVAETIVRMRKRANEEIATLTGGDYGSRSIDPMIVEGVPFIEITKIANDLECDLIVLGSHGGDGGLAQILFGSTAEKVLRATRRPVLCVG